MSVTTTRKTDVSDVLKITTTLLCPMTRKTCLNKQCRLWDDERDTCALDALSLYHMIREAVTDAAVDVHRAYGGDGLHG